MTLAPDSAPRRGRLGRAVRLIGWPSLAVAAVQVIVLAVAWPLLLGAGPQADQQSGIALFAVWFGGGVIAGFVDGVIAFYGGPAPSLRSRLVVGGLRLEGAGARMLVLVLSLGLGDLAGRVRVASTAVESATGLEPWPALLIAVLFGILGALAAVAALLMVVVPIGFVIASFLPVPADEKPANVFGVMSVGELRGGSLTLLSLSWLIPGLLLMGYRVGGEDAAWGWLISCGVAVVLAVVGVVINNLAVKKRNRAGVVTVFDQGLRGLRRRRR